MSKKIFLIFTFVPIVLLIGLLWVYAGLPQWLCVKIMSFSFYVLIILLVSVLAGALYSRFRV